MADYELVLNPQYFHAQRSVPAPGFTFSAKLRNPGTVPVMILQMSASMRHTEPYISIQTSRPVTFHRPIIEPGKAIDVNLDVDFSLRALRAVEEARGARPEVAFTFEFETVAAEAVSVALQGGERKVVMPASPGYAQVSVEGSDGRVGSEYRIARDKWLGLLKAFNFADLEVFELPELVLEGAAAAPEAHKALAAAVTALRMSGPEEALARCRSAFEAVSTAAGKSDDLQAGFEALFAKVLRDEHDEPKKKPLNDIIAALGKFQHLGRHLKHPFTPVDQADALLSVRVSLALFEYFAKKAK